MTTRLLQVQQKALKHNDQAADKLRRQFQAAGTFVVSIVSSPGSGKTALLEATLASLRMRYRVGALVGDLATDNDGRRLARAQVPVHQINTGEGCHLNAQMVQQALDQWNAGPLDVLFIENVGNLVCPASYDLGEHMRVVLLSVTEGDDKPSKYPVIFNTSDVAIITKSDLLTADVGFDVAAARTNIHAVHSGMQVLELSSRTGHGMSTWLSLLESRRACAHPTPLQQELTPIGDQPSR